MEIIYREGNVLEADALVLAHGCNCQGVMGSGVAKQIRDRWPSVYSEYRAVYEKEKLKLGHVQLVQIPNKWVANCMTQDFYGTDRRQVDYEAVAKCMELLELRVPGLPQVQNGSYQPAVAMPQIGAGLAGGSWQVIEKIIESSFKIVQPIVYVYKP